METFTIIPVKSGEFAPTAKGAFMYQEYWGVTINPVVIMYLIKGRDKVILVDTGCGDEERAKNYHHPLNRPADERPAIALKKHGVDVEDVDIVVNTHLHWDHCYNNDLFPKAKIYIQKKEMSFAISPLLTQVRFYETHQVGLTPGWLKAYDRIVAVDGDANLAPGIDLVTLPGHTPGFQGVLVNTAVGRYLIASDTVGLFENWEGIGIHKHVISGIHYNIADYYQTFEKMEKISDHVLPGHDPLVFAHQTYPY
jgi:glyoxylase-like metal-dependent hydrolase (beta-lactamase superfamily II)